MPSYKLTYFNGRGRGEMARLCFAAKKVKFVDDRIEQSDWPALKPKTRLGTLPILKEDDKEIIQSMAVVRHLARTFGLYGDNNMQAAAIDVTLDTMVDLRNELFGAFFEADETKKAGMMKKYQTETLPKILDYIEAKFKEHKSDKFFIGNKLTVADLALYDTFSAPFEMNESAFSKYPKILENRKAVEAIEGIKEYLASRPKTAF